jgi:DNA-binding XRE family transcriptional regulator
VQNKRVVPEKELAALAKSFRKKAGKSKADAARELGVAAPSIFNAEEQPEMSLTKLRIRLIETYSPYEVSGPVFMLTRKT